VLLSLWEVHKFVLMLSRRSAETEDDAKVSRWRAQWDPSFLDLTEAVKFLLKSTSEDSMIRSHLLEIDWSRVALAAKDREH